MTSCTRLAATCGLALALLTMLPHAAVAQAIEGEGVVVDPAASPFDLLGTERPGADAEN